MITYIEKKILSIEIEETSNLIIIKFYSFFFI